MKTERKSNKKLDKNKIKREHEVGESKMREVRTKMEEENYTYINTCI